MLAALLLAFLRAAEYRGRSAPVPGESGAMYARAPRRALGATATRSVQQRADPDDRHDAEDHRGNAGDERESLLLELDVAGHEQRDGHARQPFAGNHPRRREHARIALGG